MKIFSYRYMWLLVGQSSINFKILTDTVEGLKAFEDEVLKLDDLDSFGKEYLCEYDISKIGVFDVLKKSELNIDKVGD